MMFIHNEGMVYYFAKEELLEIQISTKILWKQMAQNVAYSSPNINIWLQFSALQLVLMQDCTYVLCSTLPNHKDMHFIM